MPPLRSLPYTILKVYIALTAPECTDSQSMLRDAQTKSLCYNFNQKWYYFIVKSTINYTPTETRFPNLASEGVVFCDF